MSDRCPICEAPVVEAPALFDGVNSRWHCTECSAWGDYANLSTEPVEAVRERLKRLGGEHGTGGGTWVTRT